MDGVLKSWAVPKGLPWGQGEKYLAVEVEDHPIEYEDFEGIMSKGNYGGATVMVWDRGVYYVYGEDPLGALKKGRLHLVLDGEKAKGRVCRKIRGRIYISDISLDHQRGHHLPRSRRLRFRTPYSSTRAIVSYARYALDRFSSRNKATFFSTFAREIRCRGTARLGRRRRRSEATTGAKARSLKQAQV